MTRTTIRVNYLDQRLTSCRRLPTKPPPKVGRNALQWPHRYISTPDLMTFFGIVNYIKEHAILNRSTVYMAHKSFLALTTWETRNEDLTKTLFNCDGHSQISCVISGVVSRNNFFLSIMGDCILVGEPPQPTIPYDESCLRFSLEEPNDPSQAMFSPDFRKFIKVIHDLMDAMPEIGGKCGISPFLTRSENGRWLFNFEFEIFREKVTILIRTYLCSKHC